MRSPILLHVFAYWVHEHLDDARTVTGRFTAFPGGAPVSSGATARTGPTWELAAGLAAPFGTRTRAWLRYETTLLRKDWTERRVTAGLAIRF